MGSPSGPAQSASKVIETACKGDSKYPWIVQRPFTPPSVTASLRAKAAPSAKSTSPK